MALDRGTRIKMIQQSAEELGRRSMPDIDLVLDELGIPFTSELDEWQDFRHYAMIRLKRASDEDLLGVHNHLDPDAEIVPQAETVSGNWREGHFRLFLSHTTANKQIAAGIRERLLDFGIDTFVAHERIEPTREWMDEIELALRTCDSLLALLTEDFVESKWCDQEVGYAACRELLIVAVRQGEDPHGFIGKYQALPGDSTQFADDTLAKRVYDTLAGHEKTCNRMAPAIAYRYANSWSFDDARANLQRLQAIPREHWSERMVELVESAGRTNRELYDGDWWGQKIPDVVTGHLDDLLGRNPAPFDLSVSGGNDDIPF